MKKRRRSARPCGECEGGRLLVYKTIPDGQYKIQYRKCDKCRRNTKNAARYQIKDSGHYPPERDGENSNETFSIEVNWSQRNGIDGSY